MKSGIREGKRTAKIIAAIKRGVETSRELADLFDASIGAISAELHRLADMGEIVRGPKEQRTKGGRPCIRWRATEAGQ